MTHRPVVLRGGRVLDPEQGLDAEVDVLLVDGVVADIGEALSVPDDAEERDASGLLVTPGLIDVHVHFREPGGEHKETIASGAMSAAAGGFTSVCAMPNTDPVIDDPAAVGFVLAAGKKAAAARVYPLGCISRGQKGERLTPIGELVDAGAVGITDDGNPVMDSGLMRLALEYASTFDIPVADHPEDLGLARGGVMNDGIISTRLGLKGKPNASEDVHIIRDILVAEATGGRIHLQHVSTRWGVDAIRRAKVRGVRVTAEASPHHLILTEEAVEGYRTEAKMNPPLRTQTDVDAVREGLRDGTLDTLATDHAPHHYDEKEQAFDDAPFGIVGLETSVGLVLTHVVASGVITLQEMIVRMSSSPASAFNLPGGSLVLGSPADVTLLDLERAWTVDSSKFVSKSRNTPFEGWELTGGPAATIVAGRVVWERKG